MKLKKKIKSPPKLMETFKLYLINANGAKIIESLCIIISNKWKNWKNNAGEQFNKISENIFV